MDAVLDICKVKYNLMCKNPLLSNDVCVKYFCSKLGNDVPYSPSSLQPMQSLALQTNHILMLLVLSYILISSHSMPWDLNVHSK